VTWNWGAGQPGGTVAETKTEGEIAITSKRGNKIKKNASPGNPAVHVERSGNDVVKRASELHVEEKANGEASEKKDNDAEPTNGEKRKHDEVEKEDDKPADAEEEEVKEDEPLEENAEGKTIKAKEPAAKKQKKEPAPKAKKAAPAAKKAEEKKEPAKPAEKKKAGRPKGVASKPKEKKEPTPRSGDGIGSRTRSQRK